MAKTTKVLDQMLKGWFAELRMQFAISLRWAVREWVLRKGWEAISSAFGPLIRAGTPVVQVGTWSTKAVVPLEFKQAKLDMSLRMNNSGRLFGLQLRPPSPARLGILWTAPGYANPKLFMEEEMRLGRGWYRVGGTLTLPTAPGPHPCVVFLSGAGPCDRDSSVGAANPFKDLAWGLASCGVGVLRVDKVTYTYGRWFRSNKSITSTDEYMNQATDAVRQLCHHPKVMRDGIFVLGHSLGASVAPQVALPTTSVAGLVIMAGPARAMYRAAIEQMLYLKSFEEEEGDFKSTFDSNLEALRRAAELADDPQLNSLVAADRLPFGIGAKYWLDARNFEPIRTAGELNKPIIVLQGDRDYQFIPKEDYSAWRLGLKDNRNAQVRLNEDLNHLFISGEGPSRPAEYEKPGNVEEIVVRDLADWILRR